MTVADGRSACCLGPVATALRQAGVASRFFARVMAEPAAVNFCVSRVTQEKRRTMPALRSSFSLSGIRIRSTQVQPSEISL